MTATPQECFPEAGRWHPAGDGRFTGTVGEDWTQGRTAFGGVVVTAALRALGSLVDPARTLRAAQVVFTGPISPGTFEAGVSVLRAGRSVTFTEARVEQQGRDCVRVLADHAAPRSTAVQVAPPSRPAAAAPDALQPLPYIPGITPEFTRHFDYRWTAEEFPFSGAARAHVQGWIRPHGEGVVDAACLASLVDAWPPPVITLLDGPAPVSTICWQLHLLCDPPACGVPAAGWWFFDDRAVAADAGYADTEGLLWAPDGRLMATSRQLVAEFSKKP